MSQILEAMKEIEAEYQWLVQKLDDDEIGYEQFVKRVDALSDIEASGRKWRINRAGEWGYWEGDAWVRRDIREVIGEAAPVATHRAANGEPPSATTCPASASKNKLTFTSWLRQAFARLHIPMSMLIAAGGILSLLLLVVVLGIIFWADGWRGSPAPTVVAIVASPITTQTMSPTPTPVPPTSTPSLTPILPAPTSTVSPSDTPLPSPALAPTETPSPAATPTFTPSPPSTPPLPPTPALRGKIAYADYDMANETYHIYLLDLSNPTPIKLIENAAEPSFSPDGKQIAYRSYASDRRGLWVQNLDGSGGWQLSYGHESARPQWSPDGGGLIYASCQAGDRHWRLYYPIDEVIEIPGQGWAADWLSDDKLIFAGAVDGQPQPGLYLANVDGSGATSFTLDRTGTAPAVSFDGRYLAYTSKGDSDDNWDVYVANADGTSIRRLTTHPARDGIPTWSPDGTYIAFASDRDSGWGIWVIDAGRQGQPRPLVSLTYGLDLHPRDATPDERHDWTLHTLTWSR